MGTRWRIRFAYVVAIAAVSLIAAAIWVNGWYSLVAWSPLRKLPVHATTSALQISTAPVPVTWTGASVALLWVVLGAMLALVLLLAVRSWYGRDG